MNPNDMTVDVNRELFEAYEHEVNKLAGDIRVAMAHNDEETFDGREWCEEHDIPESVFADAIDWNYDLFDYGVSPMYPWRNDYDE